MNSVFKMHALLFALTICFFSMTCVMGIPMGDIDVDFGADAYVRGYSKKTNANSKDQGFAQLIRLEMDLKTKDKVRISTRTILSGDKWNGDEASNNVNGNSSSSIDGGNSVRLDYGFIEADVHNAWMVRAGRQTANFSECFNTCDDRRDRLMLYKFYGTLMPVILYDKRVEGSFNQEGDDGDMYALALFNFGVTHEWALLYATWINDDSSYVLKDVHNFSPYYKYKSKDLTVLAVWNWLGAGSRGSWYHGHHNSFALKGEYRLNKNFDISGQAIMSEDGGLIAGGYDTYSFVINNDPANNRSNTKLVSIGGLGTFTGGSDDDESFYVTRVRHFWGKLTTSLAVGQAKEHLNNKDYDLMLYDFQMHYQYSKNLLFKAGLALVRDDRQEEATLFQMETAF